MISIQIGPEPQILKDNDEKWGEEFEASLNNDEKIPHRYRNKSIKESLREETQGKCAYCESSIEHVAFSHIEHIIPKSIRPLLVCSWGNLTLACQKCNTYKGDYYTEEAPLLNPYLDEVEKEIVFYGPMAIDRSDKAKLTISKLRLNRADLLFRREQMLRSVLQVIDLMAKTEDNPALKEALKDDLHDKLSSTAEYTSCARNFSSIESVERSVIA